MQGIQQSGAKFKVMPWTLQGLLVDGLFGQALPQTDPDGGRVQGQGQGGQVPTGAALLRQNQGEEEHLAAGQARHQADGQEVGTDLRRRYIY